MDQFFGDFDENEFLDEIDDAPLANYGEAAAATEEVEAAAAEQEEEEGPRTVDRVGSYEIKTHMTNSKWKCIDDNIIVKDLLGKGAFCKVKEAEITVWRPGKKEGDAEIEGTQRMAFKIFNRLILKS